LVAAFGPTLPFETSASKTSFQVEYINDRLMIDVDKVGLGRVLEAIREKTGVEFVLSQGLSEVPISIQLGPLPVVESLERILCHSNHAFILGADQRLVKVVILDYSKSDSSPRPREVAETPSVRRGMSPSLAETKDITQPTPEDSGVRSGGGVISSPSAEMMARERSAGEEMVVTPPTENMAIHPASMDMVVTPSLETMVVKPASVEMIVTPPTGAMTPL
jgi:hypothetical protein